VTVVTLANPGSPEAYFEYIAPKITAVVFSNGPATGNSRVTLWGSVFGTFARPVSLNIGPTSCNRTIWNSDSSMFVVTPQGTGTVKSLLLSMSQIQIETFLPDLSPIFKFDAPSLEALTSNGPPFDEQGKAVVTLIGSNFGASDVGWYYDQVSALCCSLLHFEKSLKNPF
jgi:hypothetical protein